MVKASLTLIQCCLRVETQSTVVTMRTDPQLLTGTAGTQHSLSLLSPLMRCKLQNVFCNHINSLFSDLSCGVRILSALIKLTYTHPWHVTLPTFLDKMYELFTFNLKFLIFINRQKNIYRYQDILLANHSV